MINPNEIEFLLPSLNDKILVEEYVQEHYDNGEIRISASMTLTSAPYEKWVDYVHSLARDGSPKWGHTTIYLVKHKNKLVGMVNIRPEVCDEYANIYGHIGYGVRPSERRKGYATAILQKALLRCEDCGLKYAITGCIEENIASQKTMIRCGGQLIRKGTGYKEGKVNLYYKFTLNKPEPMPELWDLYDNNKQTTGKTHVRGVWPIPDGYYHLIVHAWIRNSKGEYLISQRASTRPAYPLMFETVGGSVIKGEDSLTSVLREIEEEVGLKLSPDSGRLVRSQIRDRIGNLECRDIVDDWLFIYDGPVDLNKSTTDEVTQVQWMTVDDIEQLFDAGKFVPTLYYFFQDISTQKSN